MLICDPEVAARAILERAGFGLHDNPGTEAIAVGLLGKGCIELVPPRAIGWAHAELATYRRLKIFLSDLLNPIEAAYSVGHELGHLHIGHHAHGSRDLEETCDAIAAALVCPRGAYQRAVEEQGPKIALARLAKAFAVTQTCAALRLGEVTQRPIAVVTPQLVRVRGAAWSWPEEEEIRRIRVVTTSTLTRVRIADGAGRWALLAAA